MPEDRIFGSALVLVSLLFIFHGGILLFAPERYLPLGTWSESTIRLVRKPPFDFWKRLVGLCLSVAVALVCGYLLILRPERSVEMLFSSDKSKLEDKTTQKLWKLYVQAFGSSCLVW